jgi:hypothetical protein
LNLQGKFSALLVTPESLEDTQELFQCEQTQKTSQQSQIQLFAIGQMKRELTHDQNQPFDNVNLLHIK